MSDNRCFTGTDTMRRLRELVADHDVQNWPEKVDGGFMKLLEMRNLLTEWLRQVPEPAAPHKLPFHDETMDGLNSLTIRPRQSRDVAQAEPERLRCEMCADSKWKSACPECDGTGYYTPDPPPSLEVIIQRWMADARQLEEAARQEDIGDEEAALNKYCAEQIRRCIRDVEGIHGNAYTQPIPVPSEADLTACMRDCWDLIASGLHKDDFFAAAAVGVQDLIRKGCRAPEQSSTSRASPRPALNAIQFIALLEILEECAEHVTPELEARIKNVLGYHTDHDTASSLPSTTSGGEA